MQIGFGGDTMIGRLVNTFLNENPCEKLWGDLLPILQSCDVNVLNLETTLTYSKQKVFKVFNFKADPKHVQALQLAHIDGVNLANNHILDYDIEGLFETISTLKKANIYCTGAGKNIEDAKKPIVITKKGTKIAILGYTDNEPAWKADLTKPGTSYIPISEEGINQIQADIKDIQCDILIISIHWGPNMRQRPPKHVIEFAHKLIDSGVNIIHGHSAHIFQGVEIYQGCPIFYDTGDFVDDYYVDKTLRNDRSFFFITEYEKNALKRIRLIPTHIENCHVHLAKDEEKRATMKQMELLSKELGTHFQWEEEGLIYTNHIPGF